MVGRQGIAKLMRWAVPAPDSNPSAEYPRASRPWFVVSIGLVQALQSKHASAIERMPVVVRTSKDLEGEAAIRHHKSFTAERHFRSGPMRLQRYTCALRMEVQHERESASTSKV